MELSKKPWRWQERALQWLDFPLGRFLESARGPFVLRFSAVEPQAKMTADVWLRWGSAPKSAFRGADDASPEATLR